MSPADGSSTVSTISPAQTLERDATLEPNSSADSKFLQIGFTANLQANAMDQAVDSKSPRRARPYIFFLLHFMLAHSLITSETTR